MQRKSFILGLVLGALAIPSGLAALEPDGEAKIKARYDSCVKDRKDGAFCDGFRDGVIYMREFGPVRTIPVAWPTGQIMAEVSGNAGGGGFLGSTYNLPSNMNWPGISVPSGLPGIPGQHLDQVSPDGVPTKPFGQQTELSPYVALPKMQDEFGGIFPRATISPP